MKRDIWLRRTAVAISVASVVLLTLTIAVARTPTLRRSVSSTVDAWRHRQVSLDRKALQENDLTVLVYARGNCPVCQQQGPLLKELVAAVQTQHKSMARIVTPRTVDEEVAYARQLGFEPQEIIVADINTIKPVQVVPSVFVVDRKGTIVHRLAGGEQLTRENISKLVAALKG